MFTMSRSGIAVVLASFVGACTSGGNGTGAADGGPGDAGEGPADAASQDAPVVACTSVNDCRRGPCG